tara:strand:- start:54 stop:2696 length:2643 start_codon:yes stop_codon:yes gene_type:complete
MAVSVPLAFVLTMIIVIVILVGRSRSKNKPDQAVDDSMPITTSEDIPVYDIGIQEVYIAPAPRPDATASVFDGLDMTGPATRPDATVSVFDGLDMTGPAPRPDATVSVFDGLDMTGLAPRVGDSSVVADDTGIHGGQLINTELFVKADDNTLEVNPEILNFLLRTDTNSDNVEITKKVMNVVEAVDTYNTTMLIETQTPSILQSTETPERVEKLVSDFEIGLAMAREQSLLDKGIPERAQEEIDEVLRLENEFEIKRQAYLTQTAASEKLREQKAAEIAEISESLNASRTVLNERKQELLETQTTVNLTKIQEDIRVKAILAAYENVGGSEETGYFDNSPDAMNERDKIESDFADFIAEQDLAVVDANQRYADAEDAQYDYEALIGEKQDDLDAEIENAVERDDEIEAEYETMLGKIEELSLEKGLEFEGLLELAEGEEEIQQEAIFDYRMDQESAGDIINDRLKDADSARTDKYDTEYSTLSAAEADTIAIQESVNADTEGNEDSGKSTKLALDNLNSASQDLKTVTSETRYENESSIIMAGVENKVETKTRFYENAALGDERMARNCRVPMDNKVVGDDAEKGLTWINWRTPAFSNAWGDDGSTYPDPDFELMAIDGSSIVGDCESDLARKREAYLLEHGLGSRVEVDGIYSGFTENTMGKTDAQLREAETSLNRMRPRLGCVPQSVAKRALSSNQKLETRRAELLDGSYDTTIKPVFVDGRQVGADPSRYDTSPQITADVQRYGDCIRYYNETPRNIPVERAPPIDFIVSCATSPELPIEPVNCYGEWDVSQCKNPALSLFDFGELEDLGTKTWRKLYDPMFGGTCDMTDGQTTECETGDKDSKARTEFEMGLGMVDSMVGEPIRDGWNKLGDTFGI